MSKPTIYKDQQDNIVSTSSNLEPKSVEGEFLRKNHQDHFLLRPCLACQVNIYQNYIILSQNGRDFAYQTSGQSTESLQQLFFLMDGTRTLEELQQIFSPSNPQVVETIIRTLDEQGLLDDATQSTVNSGSNALEELNDLTQNLLTDSFNDNLFWKYVTSTESNLPVNVLYGFAMEQYQLFSCKSSYYASVLNYPCSFQIRQLINEWSSHESATEKLLLEALNTIGISHGELIETIPLSETRAMCNALAYWANSEPLFFFYVMGIIKEREAQNWQAYLEACELNELDTLFLTPLNKLIRLNLENKHKNETRCLFREISHLDEKTKQRFLGQIHLFIEIYNNLHTSVWSYYSSTNNLLRRVSLI